MASPDKYLKCIVDNMTKLAGYGEVRTNAAKDAYARNVERNLAGGMTDSEARPEAMAQVMRSLEKKALEKKTNLLASSNRLAEAQSRLEQSLTIKQLFGTAASKLYQGLRAMMEFDPRMPLSNKNFVAIVETQARIMFSEFRGVIDEFSRNWAGVQRGSVTTSDIVTEMIKPGSTNNKAAKDIAEAIKRRDKWAISEMRRLGITADFKEGEVVFHPVGSKLSNIDKQEFIDEIEPLIDWTRSGAGYYVRPAERAEWLSKYYDAVITGDFKEMPKAFEQTGGEFARRYHNDRLLQFKTGDGYAQMHAKYMDGSFVDTIHYSTNKLAHNIGVATIFGPTPLHTEKQILALAKRMAQKHTPTGSAVTISDKLLGRNNPKGMDKYVRKYNNIADIALYRNPMDPESRLGQVTSAVSNFQVAAMLGSSSFVSVLGDLGTIIANRLANHEPIIGVIGAWGKAIIANKASNRDMLLLAHTGSEFMGSGMIETRYGVGLQAGTTVSRYVADKTLRLAGVQRGFTAARAADTLTRAKALYESRALNYNELRELQVLKRNDISEAEWKLTQKAMDKGVYSPVENIGMFRPMDHVDELGADLVTKWQRLFYNEGRRSVMESTLEARAMLMGNARMDTVSGALRASMAKFHNFSVTLSLSLFRTLLAADSPGAALMVAAKWGLATTAVAAMSIQARNYWQGKEFADMHDPEFWLKAVLSSGVTGYWGDLISGGMRADTGQAIVGTLGGPLVAMLGEASNLTMGSAFEIMDFNEKSGKWSMGKEGVHLVDFMRNYMIPQPWFVAPAMQRYILEPLQEQMDKQTMLHRYKSRKGFAKSSGTPYRKGYGPGEGGIIPGFPGS